MINNGIKKNKFWGCNESHGIGWGTYEFRMPSRLPNPESETFSIGPKYSSVAYKAELSSRTMTDKMATVVSSWDDGSPLLSSVGRKRHVGNLFFHFSTSTSFRFTFLKEKNLQKRNWNSKTNKIVNFRPESFVIFWNLLIVGYLLKRNELGLSDHSIWNVTFGFVDQLISSRQPHQINNRRCNQ